MKDRWKRGILLFKTHFCLSRYDFPLPRYHRVKERIIFLTVFAFLFQSLALINFEHQTRFLSGEYIEKYGSLNHESIRNLFLFHILATSSGFGIKQKLISRVYSLFSRIIYMKILCTFGYNRIVIIHSLNSDHISYPFVRPINNRHNTTQDKLGEIYESSRYRLARSRRAQDLK